MKTYLTNTTPSYGFFFLQQVDDSLLDKQQILHSDQSGAFLLPSFLLTCNFPLTDKILQSGRNLQSVQRAIIF